MRPVDMAIVCPACGHRSTSKVQAFEHERPHLVAMQAALQKGWSWGQYEFAQQL